MSTVKFGTSNLPQIDDENNEGILRRINDELTIDNIIKLLETQGIGSKQLVLNLLKNADETQLTQLYQSVLFKINEKRRRT